MKNWEKLAEGTIAPRLACMISGIDPDAEWVEPAKPQPEAEYDAGWANDFWLAFLRANPGTHTALDERRVLAAEAARREREKWEKKQERLTLLADILNAVGCAALGQSHAYDWREPAPELTNVLALRAELDEMVAKVDVLHATCREYEQRIADLQKGRAQPSADLAELVKEAQRLRDKWPHNSELYDFLIDIAQAVAGMNAGGGK